jgi:hypothetical protein
MRKDRMLNIKDKMLARIDDIYCNAELYCYSGKQITNKYLEIVLMTDDYNRLPLYMKEYIRGYKDCKAKDIWHKLVFSYVVNGKRLAIDTPEYKAIDYFYIYDNCLHSGAYVWRKDTSKLFTVPQAYTSTMAEKTA